MTDQPDRSALPRQKVTEGEHLSRRGFDGLYHPIEPCGCWIGDLRPCGETRTGCRGGYEAGDGAGIFRLRVKR